MKLAVQFQSRVTQVLLKNSSNQTVRTQTWTYDAASNVLTHTTGGVQTSYGYDDIDQLVSESRNGYSASYAYDANGNRLTRTVNSVTEDYVYDDADKLLEVNVGQQTVKEFTYDSAGRTTAVETSAGTTSLTYDYESRVTGITYPSQSTNSFTYNGLDTRVGMTDSGGSKTFLRDGVSVTSPVLLDGSADYTPAISERRSSTTTFYHAGIKNGDSQTSTGQSVTGSIQHDAFGNVASSSGTWSGPFAYGGPYGYQSDPDSGLKLLGHRYYDPSTGRFLTRDPVKDGRNWYGYCGSAALVRTDPTGTVTLVFNGTKLKWFRDDGTLVDSVPAFSGAPGKGRRDQGQRGGPIPEGTYSIDPNEDQYATYNIFAYPWAGYPPSPAWGDRRIPLKGGPDVPGRTGGYFLHGGEFVGSIGCIDIGPNDIKIIDKLGKLTKKIKLVVDYMDWNGTVPSSDNNKPVKWKEYLQQRQ
ncbi:MAG: hypothetical protein KJZ62_11040 [Fimbriimonadaceae bacterium]|nr:hypothetical protein [Fimbriimonadaceae bacterium]MCL4285621.1 hypothetical protein [Fimbriimonadaceae bacterium]